MKIFSPGQFPKLAFIPALSFAIWTRLAFANFAIMGVHLIGAWWAGWWAFDTDVQLASAVGFIVLGFTPLDFSAPRIFYLLRLPGSAPGDFTPASRWRAWRMRKVPGVEIHRVYWQHGKVIHGERLQ